MVYLQAPSYFSTLIGYRLIITVFLIHIIWFKFFCYIYYLPLSRFMILIHMLWSSFWYIRFSPWNSMHFHCYFKFYIKYFSGFMFYIIIAGDIQEGSTSSSHIHNFWTGFQLCHQWISQTIHGQSGRRTSLYLAQVYI